MRDEYGRIDGVVYAAGVIEDKLVADKDPESFARVYGTKVDGARSVLDALDQCGAGPRFVVLFGSIAAVSATAARATTPPPTTRSTPWPRAGRRQTAAVP